MLHGSMLTELAGARSMLPALALCRHASPGTTGHHAAPSTLARFVCDTAYSSSVIRDWRFFCVGHVASQHLGAGRQPRGAHGSTVGTPDPTLRASLGLAACKQECECGALLESGSRGMQASRWEARSGGGHTTAHSGTLRSRGPMTSVALHISPSYTALQTSRAICTATTSQSHTTMVHK